MIEVRSNGLTRRVLLVGRWAIKVPRLTSHDEGLAGVMWSFVRGVSANLSEAEQSGAPGVCPVTWSLAGLINVYPRCKPVNQMLTSADYRATGYIGPAERKPANMGYLNGTLVYVDYDHYWNDRPPCQHVAPDPRVEDDEDRFEH